MSVNAPYCGIGKIPKGRVRGNVSQCIEQGQVRYWGEKKADSRQIYFAVNPKKRRKTVDPATRDKLILAVQTARGGIRRFEQRVEDSKKRVAKKKATDADKSQLKVNEAELKKHKDNLKRLLPKLKKVITELDRAKQAAKKAAEPPKPKKKLVKKTPKTTTKITKRLPLKPRAPATRIGTKRKTIR